MRPGSAGRTGAKIRGKAKGRKSAGTGSPGRRGRRHERSPSLHQVEPPASELRTDVTARPAADLHRDALVFDAHTDTIQRVLMDGVDLGTRSTGDPLVERADLPRYREGGVDAQVFAIWVDTIYLPDRAVRRALQQIDAFHRMLDDNAGAVGYARTAGDVRRLREDGRFAALLSIEGGDAIERDLGVLRAFERLGACSMTLCHSRSTDWVDSSTDEPRWNGLNELGRRVVGEMNRLGMVVDVTHTSDSAVRDVLRVSEHPVIASHSNCRALCDHPRNLPDPLLEAIAAGGGVVGINVYSGFLSQAYLDEFRRTMGDVFKWLNEPPAVDPADLDRVARERLYGMSEGERLGRPPFSTVLDHVDHAVAVAGIDHVGLGSDLDVPHLATPEGFDDVTAFPRITEGLVERGYAEEDVRKVLGGNFLRLWEAVTGG